MQIIVLSREDIELLHDFVLSVSPGKKGVLHDEYIESATQRPYTYMQYEDADIHTVAALAIDSLGRNHAFNDGNKRTALMCAIYLYAINGVYLEFTNEMNDEFEELVLWVVKKKPSIHQIKDRLIALVEKYELGTFESFMRSMRTFFG